jgi:hypothetical protein
MLLRSEAKKVGVESGLREVRSTLSYGAWRTKYKVQLSGNTLR